jgi:hypothetical protein
MSIASIGNKIFYSIMFFMLMAVAFGWTLGLTSPDRWWKEATDLLKVLIDNSKLVKRIGIYEIRQIGI